MNTNPQDLWKERFAVFVQKLINKRKETHPDEAIEDRQVWFSQWMKSAVSDAYSLKKQKEEENAGRAYSFTPSCGISKSDLLHFSLDYHLILHILLRERLISSEMSKRLEIEEINKRDLKKGKIEKANKKKLPKGQLYFQS